MKNRTQYLLSIAIFVSLTLALGPGGGVQGAAVPRVSEPGGVAPALPASSGPVQALGGAEATSGSTPPMFIENVGQFDARARFHVRGGGGTLWLAQDAIWLTVVERAPAEGRPLRRPADQPGGLPSSRLDGEADGEGRGVHLKLSFPGANADAVLEPFSPLQTSVNYFIGSDPAGWRTDVPVYSGVRYVDLYPGVDLELTGEAGRWAWRMVCRAAPCEPSLQDVRLQVEGAETMELLRRADEGEGLQLTTAVGELWLPLVQPVAADGTPWVRRERPVVRGDEVTAPFCSGMQGGLFGSLRPGSSAPDQDLVYATFLGGSGVDGGGAIAVGDGGEAYVAGWTLSSDFPTTDGAFQTSYNGDGDVFVVKMNPAGSALIYATFLGGSGWDTVDAMAVDGQGAAYVTGSTRSSDFPTTPDAFDTSLNVDYDAFVVKLNPAGSALVYATFLGGSQSDRGRGIAVDGEGAAYVTGWTRSDDFPTTDGAFQTSYNGGFYDAFVVKLNPAGSDLAYATFLGGSHSDLGRGIAVDGEGAAYVTGYTSSSDFPTAPGAFDTSPSGGVDVFVAKLNPAGSDLAYATFLGRGEGYDIAVDRDGAAYVTGITRSDDFPTTNGAFQTSYGGEADGFVVKLNPTGSALDYATFLGGSEWDTGNGIAVDRQGAAYVTGGTGSSDFPTTPDAFDRSYNGGDDAFVVKLNPAGSDLAHATFLGGSAGDYAESIAVDGDGAAYVAGYTWSSDFPTTPGAFDTSYNGDDDAFVVKLAIAPTPWEVFLPVVLR